jgi:hypothetical protein
MGKNLKLIVMDGAPGSWAAAQERLSQKVPSGLGADEVGDVT